jgi:hypothetical protein
MKKARAQPVAFVSVCSYSQCSELGGWIWQDFVCVLQSFLK